MTLAYFDGRFREVYVSDLDRSYNDAVFTGQRVYQRDLETGDSVMVYDDTSIVELAAQHARLRPDARRLAPDEDAPDDPDVTATGETDILGVRGPYVLLEHRSSFQHADAEQDDTVQTAVDLRTGRGVTPGEVDRARGADTTVIRTLPAVWHRRGFVLLARGSRADSVSFSMRDDAGRTWPLLTVSEQPRVYWLDATLATRPVRRALTRAFNAAASYDDDVRYTALHTAPGVRRPGHARTPVAHLAARHSVRRAHTLRHS